MESVEIEVLVSREKYEELMEILRKVNEKYNTNLTFNDLVNLMAPTWIKILKELLKEAKG